ncbi:MAG TPA: RES family NAD+ phosphorylase [Micropepsaceae bacterium]|nr:RES family NAD+ phosphorylase [Micropepsaceae bacterium]
MEKEIAFRSTVRGKCAYCSSEDAVLIEAAELGDKFRTLLDAYETNDQGKTLVAWLREDWDLFPDLDDAHAKELLGDIFDDGDLPRKTFLPLSQGAPAPVGRWEELRKELMHRNRFFPEVQIDLDNLRQLLSALKLDAGEVPTTWYRARIMTEEAAFPIEKMGAPPQKIAVHGRANPAGIPYLYVASDKLTAISEVRPHTGEKVCVADFTTPNDLSLIDLRNPRRTVSPFALADLLPDETNPGQMRLEIAFLQRLGAELTQPVLPTVAAFEYTPSQYLCEFIKKCGYDGVIYRSAIGDGMNLALFKPEKAAVGAVETVAVTRVHVEFE